MSENSSAKAVGMGIAGGAVAMALLDLLADKGLISQEDARTVLEDALYRAAMFTGTWEGHEATQIIGAALEAVPAQVSESP
jgi:polyhydroxyalkanoate synthesis regulator phasin